MSQVKELRNSELEQVSGGEGPEQYDGFKVGDWVKFKRGSSRRSPQGAPDYYRIREFGEKMGRFITIYLDMYLKYSFDTFSKRDGGSCLADEIVHARKPFGFREQ